MIRLGILLSLFALLNACSFHLRGYQAHYPATFGPIAIHVEHADSAWESLLRQQCTQAKLLVVKDKTQARYWLTIHAEETKNTIISISSSSSPRQYELNYTVTFSVESAKSSFIPPTTLHINRPITINNDRILGSHDEEEKLTQDIRRDAAIQILDRMNRRAWSTLIEPAPHRKA